MRQPETVLVIGGQGGIGSQVCQQLLDHGHRVIATSRHPRATGFGNPGREHIWQDSLTWEQLDLQSDHLRADLRSILDCHPDITSIIHCAGTNTLAGAADLDDNELDRMLTVNLRSAMSTGAVASEYFRHQDNKDNRGTLLFVGSMLGQIGVPGYSAYSASKFGLRGYAEALRRELLHHGIQVLLVSPRATRTGMNSNAANQLNEQLGNQQDDPARVAAQIVAAWNQSRPRTSLGWPEKFFAWLNGNFPSLVDQALSKQAVTVEAHLVSGGQHS